MAAAQGPPLWSLIGSGASSTITASGSSGAYTASAVVKALDVSHAADLTLFITVAGATGTSPSMTVKVNLFDDQGNSYSPTPLTGAAITAAVQQELSAGLHGGSASAYLVVPTWAQVVWTVTGTTPSFTGCQFALYGR